MVAGHRGMTATGCDFRAGNVDDVDDGGGVGGGAGYFVDDIVGFRFRFGFRFGFGFGFGFGFDFDFDFVFLTD